MGGLGKARTPGILNDLQGQSKSLMSGTKKPRQAILQQLNEALRTGGVGAKIPLIQQAVSQQNQANSQALRQTAEGLAQRNIGGPFGARIMAEQRLQGAQESARLPTSIAEQFIQQMTPFLSSTQSLGVGGMGQAAGLQSQLGEFNAGQQVALIGALGKGLAGPAGGLLGGK